MRIIPRSVTLACQCGKRGCRGSVLFNAPGPGKKVPVTLVSMHGTGHTVILGETTLIQLRQYLDDLEVTP